MTDSQIIIEAITDFPESVAKTHLWLVLPYLWLVLPYIWLVLPYLWLNIIWKQLQLSWQLCTWGAKGAAWQLLEERCCFQVASEWWIGTLSSSSTNRDDWGNSFSNHLSFVVLKKYSVHTLAEHFKEKNIKLLMIN